MNTEERKRLRELCEKATKGPWEAKEPAFAPGIGRARVFGPGYAPKHDGKECIKLEDAELIAAARNALPAILDEVDRLEARVKELSNPATWRATINRLESAELEALAELDERIAENSALKARVEKLEEVRKAATLNVEKMERITDIDWTETDEYWALRAALDGVKP